MTRSRFAWVSITLALVALTIGMYVVLVSSLGVERRVNELRTELKQDVVDEVTARIDSLNNATTIAEIHELSAKIDSLWMAE